MEYWCRFLLLVAAFCSSRAFQQPFAHLGARHRQLQHYMASDDGDAPAGSFFNPVPGDDDGNDEEKQKDIDQSLEDLLKERKEPSLASTPSTIKGVPTSEVGKGFAPKAEEGYTLYADEETGERSRVFEALVEYPSIFSIKIVGANEGTFVEDMVQVVADSCETKVEDIEYSTKQMGKWISVTVQAPVESAEMLYSLYENVDKDPRVKFKF